MNIRTSLSTPLAALLVWLAAGFAPAAAASAISPPSDQVNGTVTSFDGKYALGVRTRRGKQISVVLHDGTVLVPRGLKLHTGLAVTVVGSPSGATYTAMQIVAPLGKGNGSKLGTGPGMTNGFYRSENPDFYPQHNGW